jgi:hypothetical protein
MQHRTAADARISCRIQMLAGKAGESEIREDGEVAVTIGSSGGEPLLNHHPSFEGRRKAMSRLSLTALAGSLAVLGLVFVVTQVRLIIMKKDFLLCGCRDHVKKHHACLCLEGLCKLTL